MSSAIRMVMDHENPASRSVAVHPLIKGVAYVRWLLDQEATDVPLTKQDFINAGYFSPVEFPFFLKVTLAAKDEAVRAEALRRAEKKSVVRLLAFWRQLEASGEKLPFRSPEILRECLHASFSSYPDYSPSGYFLLENLAECYNALLQAEVPEEDLKPQIESYTNKLKNVVLR